LQTDNLREMNPAKKPLFDAIVANPPFSYRWEPGEAAGGGKASGAILKRP
jgi:tRNA1(Val) A37 N6-methylase TrmN6